MPRRIAQSAFLSFCLLASLASSARAASLEDRLQPLLKAHEGQVAVAVRHLTTGESFTHRADEPMPTASLIKLAVMVETYRQAEAGTIDLDAPVTVTKDDFVPGSGVLTSHFSPGTQFPLRDAVRLMIVYSDNTATNLVLDKIGLKATAETMEKLGFPHTKIHSKVFKRDSSVFPDRSDKFGLGSTTAAEMVRLLEQLHAKKLVSEKASTAMLAHLFACDDKKKLPRYLPDGTKVAHKTGSVNAVRTDAGTIETPGGPVAVCVLTSENKDQRWTDENAGDVLIAKIGRAVSDHFSEGKSSAEPPQPLVLKLGDSGDMVQALQRTLNARMKDERALAVDGDFGPATQAAVIRFQKAKKLETSGLVAADTWAALGALVEDEQPVPDPEVVNAETLPVKPAEPLDGPPVVSCKAWAIGDGKTGSLLWGDHEADKVDIASTTKMMTAWLVVRLAEQQPAVFDEELVFSRRADETPGSTAGVRAGERLPVREALYGLMLPSGNDAATALAEHFGARFEPESGNTDRRAVADPLARFVAEMNRTAAALGMNETSYRNPHGLTDKDHQSSARDLLKLAATAMQSDLYRSYVGTRQRGCRLVGAGGYQRNVVWKNTNQLLEVEGYAGVKTGTTNAAGACLVSCGCRGEEDLIVVVLGATSPEGRYVDTRNLFRWAWQQDGTK